MSNFFSWRSAFQKSDLPPTTKLVLFCISTYMNDHGEGAFPSIRTLMKDTSLSNRAVILHIKKAQEEGYLKVSQHGLGGQAWKRNEYRISIPKVVTLTTKGGDSDDTKVVTLTTEGGDPNDQKVVTQGHTNTPSNSPSNSPKKEAPSKIKKGMRIENYFKGDRGLPNEYRSEAIRLGLNEPDEEWDSFYDFWVGVSDKGACKLDWLATWRNRVRKAVKRQGNNPQGYNRPSQSSGDTTVTGARMALDRRRTQDGKVRQPAEAHDYG